MLKHKMILAITLICSLFLIGYINSSDAFDIEEVRPYYSNWDLYDWGSGVSHYTYVRTSEPYYSVTWYVNGVYAGYNYGGHTTTETSNYFSVGTGSIKGNKYTIRADACMIDDDGNTFNDTDSYEVTVWKPQVETEVHGGGGQQLPDVSGRVELTRHYFDGINIIMEGSVSAYNGSDDDVNCHAWFKHTRFNGGGFDPQDNAPNEDIGSGQSYGPHSADTMVLNFFVGGSIGDESYQLNAHIHLVTGVDNRHVDSTNWFTSMDNP